MESVSRLGLAGSLAINLALLGWMSMARPFAFGPAAPDNFILMERAECFVESADQRGKRLSWFGIRRSPYPVFCKIGKTGKQGKFDIRDPRVEWSFPFRRPPID
jgi:hypothetical protein